MKAVVAPVLDSPARQKIITLLYLEPRSPSELAAALGLSQPYISNHLAALKSHHMVRSQRVGRRALYELEEPVRSALQGALAGVAAGAAVRG